MGGWVGGQARGGQILDVPGVRLFAMVTGSAGQNVKGELSPACCRWPTVHCCVCVSASGWWAMFQRQRCDRRVGSTSKRAADRERVCRRSLQYFAAIISFDGAAEEGHSWGRGLVPRPILSGRLQLTPVTTTLAAFALFLGGGLLLPQSGENGAKVDNRSGASGVLSE